MEKYSRFRDPATGIQPFLTPTYSPPTSFTSRFLLPLRLLIGIIRTALVLLCALLYFVLVDLFCSLLKPLPAFNRLISGLLTTLFTKLVLIILGVVWIDVETVSLKRARSSRVEERWSPLAGDVIISNSISWIEVLWLASRFNPIFLRPSIVISSQQSSPSPSVVSSKSNVAADALYPPLPKSHAKLIAFERVALLSMICSTGFGPKIVTHDVNTSARPFEYWQESAERPLVVLPELTTSNGKSLLAMSACFTKVSIPVKKFCTFIMSVRCDAPSEHQPTLSHSLPTRFNPLGHIWSLCNSFGFFRTLTIRLLAPTEAPSCGTFLVSEILREPVEDELSEVCGSLIARLGKLKRIQYGWEMKLLFLDYFKSRKN